MRKVIKSGDTVPIKLSKREKNYVVISNLLEYDIEISMKKKVKKK